MSPRSKPTKKWGQRFVDANSAEADDFSQATSSSNRYKQAVARALEKAKANPAVTTEYSTVYFVGKSAADDHGYGLALVTIKEDKVQA